MRVSLIQGLAPGGGPKGLCLAAKKEAERKPHRGRSERDMTTSVTKPKITYGRAA